MPEYEMYSHPAPRARDFYDIYRICEHEGVRLNTKAGMELLGQMFAAKRVPLELLLRIADHREFHKQNWPEVIISARERLTDDDYDRCFDYVLGLVAGLKLSWNE